MRPLDPEIAAQVGAWLATYLAHGVAMFVAAWLGARLVRSARVREQLWRAALFGPLVTASLQLGAGIAPLGGRWDIALERSAAAEPPALIADLTVAAPFEHAPVADGAILVLVDEANGFHDVEDNAWFGIDGDVPLAATPVAPESPGDRPFSLVATALLAAGIGALMLRALLEALRVQRLGRGVVLTRGPIVSAAESYSRRAGLLRRVRIEVTERGSSPYATGVLRPRIVVPERAMAELDDAAIRAMVAHELGHIVRFDPLWTAAVRSVAALFFFQPLNWVIARRLDECAELCCDEFAVEVTGDEVALARCLASVADWIVGANGARPACAMAHKGSPLRHRVERILATGGHVRRRHVGARLMGAAVVCATTLAVPGFAITLRPATPDIDFGHEDLDHDELHHGSLVHDHAHAMTAMGTIVSAPAPPPVDLPALVATLRVALEDVDRELDEVAALSARRRVSKDAVAELGALRDGAVRIRSLIDAVDALVERRSALGAAAGSAAGPAAGSIPGPIPTPAPTPFQGRSR